MPPPLRKAHGDGRMSIQKRERQRKAKAAVKELAKVIDWDVVSDTQSFFPRGSLKTRSNRDMFQFVLQNPEQYRGRYFTERLGRLIVRRLLSRTPEDVLLPTHRGWINDQARRFLNLARRAKKGGAPSQSQRPAMDDLNTLPWEARAVMIFCWFLRWPGQSGGTGCRSPILTPLPFELQS